MYYIPKPPKEIFFHQGTIEQGILKENPVAFVIERVVLDDQKGIQVYYKDHLFPRKGFPTPEAVSSANTIKRIIIETIKTFTYPQFMIGWFLLIFSKTKQEKLFLSFNRITYSIISIHIIKPEFMSPLASELQGLIFVFLVRMGIAHGTARQFSLIFGSVIEYDNAYRYRLEDLFSETTKEKVIENPYKECKRLLQIALEREQDWTVGNKYKAIYKLIALPLKLGMVKYAIRSALSNCEFGRLQFDEADKYWCKNRTDYNFEGKSYGERMKNYKSVQGINIIV